MKDLAVILENRSGALAEMGEALYSDHDHQLILVVDDMVKGRAVSEAWAREATPTGDR